MNLFEFASYRACPRRIEGGRDQHKLLSLVHRIRLDGVLLCMDLEVANLAAESGALMTDRKHMA